MASRGGQDFDDVLKDIAKEIKTDAKVDDLGKALGISVADIEGYKVTNKGGSKYDGSLDMLRDWNKTQSSSTVRDTLRRTLEQVGRVDLRERHFSTHGTDDGSGGARQKHVKDGTYNMKISGSLNVLRCREKLENKYLTKFCKIQMKPWDVNYYAEFESVHTHVTMVKKDTHESANVKKEVQHGSVADILSMKVNNKLPSRILISAGAGRGKTTAVAKMAYDWSHRVKGSGLEELPLLFVVKLRNAGQDISLGEAIKYQLLRDVDDLTPEALENFIRENQGICHIIFDGLDEYAGMSSGSNIVKIMLWDEYLECRVIITTRPHLENFFNQGDMSRVYIKIAIEGFSRESSREYIDKFFASDISKGQALKVYLDGQPLINELVTTPLFCLMVCHLWSEGLLTHDVATQTKLLDSVNIFLLQHANNRSNSTKITTEQLRTIIAQLGEVALAGLLSDAKKPVFSPDDFSKFPTIFESACELGIISQSTVSSPCLPRSDETTSTTVEFYHKLAQEHSAAKNIAVETNEYWLPWMRLNMSKLDRVLYKIKSDIGDYENLLRFTAGTDDALCTKIMWAILTNESLDESEKYRILLDCSSETTGAKGNASALVRRCVSSSTIVLKSPTVYTVVGMQNLPEELKRQVRAVKFEKSTITAESDLISELWSCLGSFHMLNTLTMSDTSLSFPASPPELPYVTKLEAESVTSQSYDGLLSSLPGLKEIDITIDDAEEDISQITAGLQRTGRDPLTHIRLHAPPSLASERKEVSRETMKGLGLLIRKQTKNLKLLAVSGVKCRDEGDFIDLVDCCRHVNSMSYVLLFRCETKEGGRLASHLMGHPISSGELIVLVCNDSKLEIKKCQLVDEMTDRLWSCLRSFTTLTNLDISDSSLSFPPFLPELPYVTKLKAERLTSQSYEGLLSSLPGLEEIMITIDDAESDICQITAGLQRTGGQQLTQIRLEVPPSLPSEKKEISKKTMRGLGLLVREKTRNLQWLAMSGIKCRDEEDLIDLVECCRYAKTMSYVLLLCCETEEGGKLDSHLTGLHPLSGKFLAQVCHDDSNLNINDCQLSAEMTDIMWSCLRSSTTLHHLIISNSSLGFSHSPLELPFVTKLKAERVKPHSYQGLLLSLPEVQAIDITIDDAERDISQITAGLRQTGGHQLTHIRLQAPSSLSLEKKKVSSETMRGLGLLIREHTKNLQWLHVSGVKCGDEEDLIDLVERCRQVKSISYTWLHCCGTNYAGRLESHLMGLHSSIGKLVVHVCHVDNWKGYRISHEG